MNWLLSAILFWLFVKILNFFFSFFNIILINFLFLASQFMKLKHGLKNEKYWKNEMWQILLSLGGGGGGGGDGRDSFGLMLFFVSFQFFDVVEVVIIRKLI
jgi:hypothetical protein